jgi:ATP phosphoribosyltransferase regulatory subunit
MSKVAACGFALTEERLQEVLSENGRVDPDRPLRIAVPKGSLFKPTIDLLERAGLDVSELREPGRRLIIPADGVEYVIVRATDAPVFVASGGADCGVCGYDSLYEANIDLVQLVDLKFGACHFVVAEPRANKGMAEASFAKRGAMRVVTKYPRITRDYYNRIGQPVDILQLHGNIELGPIVGMADRIVDITATGTTLRENDLVVVDDDVLACTARFFASPAAYRSNTALRTLADRLADLV